MNDFNNFGEVLTTLEKIGLGTLESAEWFFALRSIALFETSSAKVESCLHQVKQVWRFYESCYINSQGSQTPRADGSVPIEGDSRPDAIG